MRIIAGNRRDPAGNDDRSAQIRQLQPNALAAPMVISGSEKIRPATQKSYGSIARCLRFSTGMITAMIQTAATTPASVGVNHPVRMPPRRMIGIISGSEALLAAIATARSGARGRLRPAGPKK